MLIKSMRNGWEPSVIPRGGHLVALLGTTSPRDGLEGEVEASLAGFLLSGSVCRRWWSTLASSVGSLRTQIRWCTGLGKSKSASPEVYQLASPTNYVTIGRSPHFFCFMGNRIGSSPGNRR